MYNATGVFHLCDSDRQCAQARSAWSVPQIQHPCEFFLPVPQFARRLSARNHQPLVICSVPTLLNAYWRLRTSAYFHTRHAIPRAYRAAGDTCLLLKTQIDAHRTLHPPYVCLNLHVSPHVLSIVNGDSQALKLEYDTRYAGKSHKFISLHLITSFASVSHITALSSIGYSQLLLQYSTEILNAVICTPACSGG